MSLVSRTGSLDETTSRGTDPGSIPSGVSQFDFYLERYPAYLRGQRGLSENTLRVYLADLVTFRKYLDLEDSSLTDMNGGMLRGYLAWLATISTRPYSKGGSVSRHNDGRTSGEGYARVSIARKLTVLRAFYRFLVQERLFDISPMPSAHSFRVKVEKPLPTFLGQQEVTQLLDAPVGESPLANRDRAILEVLYSCGVRLAEVQELDLADVDITQRQILVKGKGSKERWVVFGGPTQDALNRYLHESRPKLMSGRTAALFLNRYGERLSRRSIERMVKGYAMKACTRDRVHPHTLRHTFATHMMEGGADLRVIQELLGHSSPTTTQIYTHVTKREARAAYFKHHPLSGAAPTGNDDSKEITQKEGE